jgi:hypothetical protein
MTCYVCDTEIGLGNDNMSLHCKEVRELLTELALVINSSSLVDEDTPFLASSTHSVTNKSKTVDTLLGEVSTGILSLLYTSSSHVRVFGLEESVKGSREMKGNLPLLHHSVIELFDVLTTVVGMIESESESATDEEDAGGR